MRKKIRLLILDVDGTLTDGKIYMGNNGEIFKVFDIKDGCGIHDILPNINVDWDYFNNAHPDEQVKGIVPIIITARYSKIISNRCNELNIPYNYQGCKNKAEKILIIAKYFGCNMDINGKYEDIAYIGDDLIDLPAMQLCGIVGCPANATKQILQIADFVCSKNGGDGAVREFIEWLIKN